MNNNFTDNNFTDNNFTDKNFTDKNFTDNKPNKISINDIFELLIKKYEIKLFKQIILINNEGYKRSFSIVYGWNSNIFEIILEEIHSQGDEWNKPVTCLEIEKDTIKIYLAE